MNMGEQLGYQRKLNDWKAEQKKKNAEAEELKKSVQSQQSLQQSVK